MNMTLTLPRHAPLPEGADKEGVRAREAEAAALLAELVAYCRRHGPPKCYTDWPEKTLENYILFQMRQKTFSYVQTHGVIGGCGVLWQLNEAVFHGRRRAGEQIFHWQPTDPHGDSLYAGEWVCTQPGALRALIRHFKSRFPNWRRLRFIPVRKELKSYA